jgi:hypothetical protein
MNYPVPMSGRIDRLYLTDDMRSITLDTKSRSRAVVGWKDVLQVSIYRMMTMYAPSIWNSVVDASAITYVDASAITYPEYAWVHVVGTGRDDIGLTRDETYFRVETYPPSVVIELWLKYFAYSDATARNISRLQA